MLRRLSLSRLRRSGLRRSSLMRSSLRRWRLADARGSVPIEGLFGSLLLLMWLIVAWEFYDAFRKRAVVTAATYTVADLISRSSGEIGPKYVTGTKKIYDIITHSSGDDQSWMRVSLIQCSASANTDPCDGSSKGFTLTSSYATGDHVALTQTTLDALAGKIPVMSAGDTASVVESYYAYQPLFGTADRSVDLDGGAVKIGAGLSTSLTFGEFIVTRPRGARTVWNASS